jgi:flagellar protein FlaJ
MSQKKIHRIPLVLLPFHTIDEMGRRMRGLGRILSLMRPSLKKELDGIEVKLDPGSYAVGSFFSALVYGVIFFLLSYLLLFFLGGLAPDLMLRVPILVGFGFFVIFFLLHLVYPSIILKKIAVREDKDLLFALREIMLGVNSGVPLFDSLKNVSIGNYGYVSDDFTMVVKDIENGKSEKEALKALVLRTESEYLRRAIWQMVNALESGASMTTALPGIVSALENHTYRMIRSYSSNLNFLMLIYMLIAAAIPSLGITFLVLLSAFSGFGVSVDKILGLIFGAAIGQVIMIGYMGSTRPAIFGG